MSLPIALAAWRQWQTSVPLLSEPTVITALAPGTTNAAIKVAGNSAEGRHSFVIRYSDSRPGTRMTHFWRERNNFALAAKHGLAPTLCYAHDASHTLVTEYIEHQPQAVTTDALAELIRRIHGLPYEGVTVNLYAQLQHTFHQAQTRGIPPDELIDPCSGGLTAALAVLKQDEPRFCHNDLHPGNVLSNNGDLLVIDWEYAGAGSAYFDVAAAIDSWPTIDPRQLLPRTLGANFCSDLWACAQAVYAAVEWNWYLAQGILPPLRCSLDQVTSKIALVK